MRRVPLTWMLASLPCAPGVFAQANQNPAVDGRLSGLADIAVMGRSGVFPAGVNGVTLSTTVCNDGSAEIDWFQAMDPRHPFIAFLLARESDGRLEQISDRSYVKHGFFAANSTGCGRPCQQPGGALGTLLGIGCSDTYDTFTNADNFWLGPPEEIDPWLGSWDPVCSHFDRGEPPVAPPQDCNGLRSLTHAQASALGPVGHRIHLGDGELNVPGALFYFQGQYVIATEPEAARANNLGSRRFTATWDGSRWDLSPSGSMLRGTVLQRWSGATVGSATNGGDDGRVYAAVKVTGPLEGFYHYEYALHDRDNARGIGAFHVPRCAGARVKNAGFHDVNDDAADDWTATVGASEIVFSTGANPLRWNTIYNFWFDSDAGPGPATFALDQFDPGPGLSSLAVAGSAPLELFNAYLGAGCALDTPPTLYATGSPARARLGNGTFALASSGNEPGQVNVLRSGLQAGTFTVLGCTFHIGTSFAGTLRASLAVADGSGVATHPLPVPNDLALEGLDVGLQAIGRDPGNGIMLSYWELSDALLVRVGNSIAACP